VLDAKLATRAKSNIRWSTMKKFLLLFVLVFSLGHAEGLLGEFYLDADSLWGKRVSAREYKYGFSRSYSDEKTKNRYDVQQDNRGIIQRVTMVRSYYGVPVHERIRPAPLGPWTLDQVKAFISAVVGNVKWKGDLTGGISEDGTLAYKVVIRLDVDNRIESADVSVGRVGFDLGTQLRN